MQSYSPYVPVGLLRPYLRDYLTTSSLMELSNCTRTDPRVLYDIINGKRVNVRFPTADRILTGMGLATEWYDNEALAQYYAVAV